jgi:8-oxo-dGTP pyrophosphatase MutT (NUDIX family)
VIPVRRRRKEWEVCLIRRRGTKAWGIPKGQVDRGETHRQAALKEAWEEAGLEGTILGRRLGTYEYMKGGTPLTVAVYVMAVEREGRVWDEIAFRERRWLPLDDADARLSGHPAHALLARARAALASTAR